jgi:hypothetical protein
MFDEAKLPETAARKRICWKSWNVVVEDFVTREQEAIQQAQEEIEAASMNPEMQILPLGPLDMVPRVLHTPLGMYPLDSMFKPSDRWDCWTGTTNFSITHGIKDKLGKIEGIEALRVIGRYTFFIGIASLFKFKDVRLDVETQLCGYTEKEVLSNEETQATVDLVKEQLVGNKYWSILVAPTGQVDYVVSDQLDQTYLDGLNELLELKQILGGVILRGDHG